MTTQDKTIAVYTYNGTKLVHPPRWFHSSHRQLAEQHAKHISGMGFTAKVVTTLYPAKVKEGFNVRFK